MSMSCKDPITEPRKIEICKNGMSWLYIFQQNMFWTFGFYYGLGMTHWDFLPNMNKFNLDLDQMSNWDWPMWLILGVIISILGSAALFIVYLWVISGKLVFFCFVMGSITYIFVIGFLSYIFPTGIHIHHYFIGLSMIFFSGHHNFISQLAHSIGCGIFIEGSVRWELDPVWQQTLNTKFGI